MVPPEINAAVEISHWLDGANIVYSSVNRFGKRNQINPPPVNSAFSILAPSVFRESRMNISARMTTPMAAGDFLRPLERNCERDETDNGVSLMKSLYNFTAATMLSVAGTAWGGVTPLQMNANIASATMNVDHVPAGSVCNTVGGPTDCHDLLASPPMVSPLYAAAVNNHPIPPVRSAAVTVVPLPPAAPAGLLTLGLIGVFGLVRRMRNRVASPG